VIHGCHAAYPVMLRQGHGQILNVASSPGLSPVYCDVEHGVAVYVEPNVWVVHAATR
jgi:short-subunit dehydrogenase